ncbi:MAG: chromosome segregation ATPase [Alphaproteobacteria bacterium]|jgi:chromosome segregation ATPase
MSDNPKDKDFAPINVELSDRIPMAGNRQSSSKSTADAPKNSSSYTSIVLVVAVIACAASAYLYSANMHNKTLLAENETRIKSLEDRLSATGEEMGNSTGELQVKVGELAARGEENFKQIDKLWASAWRRNQQEINTLESSFNNLQQDTNRLVKELDANVSDNKTTVAAMQSRIDGVNTKVNAQANGLLSLNVRQDENQQTNTVRASTLRDMTEKLILLEKRNTSLLQKIQQLENKLNELINKSV